MGRMGTDRRAALHRAILRVDGYAREARAIGSGLEAVWTRAARGLVNAALDDRALDRWADDGGRA